MTLTTQQRTDRATDLLQLLIRNQCVNDGSVASGHEIKSADMLRAYLEGPGIVFEEYEPSPGRRNLVAKIEGSDPDAPSLTYMGHLDVVPANPDGWSRDPFGGELVDGFVWGRGAVDMLNLTTTMAVAFRELADSGFRPRGDLTYLAVADEEAQGTWGADWLLEHDLDAVRTDYLVTELGGFQMPTAQGVRLPVMVAEKGLLWIKVRVHGTPGHASKPYHSDNALVIAAELVRRIASYAPKAEVSDTWRRFVAGMHFAPELEAMLLDPERIDDACAQLAPGMGREVHACTHTTLAPTMIHGGTKTNVIPDLVEFEVDMRTLPGVSGADARALIETIIGEYADRVEIITSEDNAATASPVDTPLWDALGNVTSRLVEGSALVPQMLFGATDSRFFRRKGAVAYGFGLFSRRIPFDDFSAMFHGNDERVDQESLGLSTDLWVALAQEFDGLGLTRNQS